MSTPKQILDEVREFVLFAAQVGRAPLVGDCDDLPGPSDCERLASGTELLAKLDSLEMVEGVRAEIAPVHGRRRFSMYEGADIAFDDEAPALLLTPKGDT